MPLRFSTLYRKTKPPVEISLILGCGGNSASPEPKRSPAALLVQSRTQQKSFLFLLEEKIGRAQIKKCEENFFAGWRALASGGGAVSLVEVLLKESSNINQKRPPICTFREIVRSCLGMVFSRENPSIFEIVKRLREKMGISQEKLACLADVSNNTIINIEAGKQGNPTIETLKKITKALNAPVEDLIK